MLKFTKTSRASELEGVWTEYDDGAGNVLKLKVARANNNPHYEARLTRLMEPYKNKVKKGKDVSNDVAKRIMNEVIGNELLLDWDSTALLDDNGKPVKYTPELSVELVTYDPDLREYVEEFAGNMSNFIDPDVISGK